MAGARGWERASPESWEPGGGAAARGHRREAVVVAGPRAWAHGLSVADEALQGQGVGRGSIGFSVSEEEIVVSKDKAFVEAINGLWQSARKIRPEGTRAQPSGGRSELHPHHPPPVGTRTPGGQDTAMTPFKNKNLYRDPSGFATGQLVPAITATNPP